MHFSALAVKGKKKGTSLEQSFQEKSAWERKEEGQEANGYATEAWRAGY